MAKCNLGEVKTRDTAGQQFLLLIVCGAGLALFQGPSIFTALLWRSSHFIHAVFACACAKAFWLPAFPSLWVGLGKYLKTFH